MKDQAPNLTPELSGIMSQPSDAVLFLCSSNEADGVHAICLDALRENPRLEELPFTICRTKADEVIRNKAVNLYRKETDAMIFPMKIWPPTPNGRLMITRLSMCV